MADQWQHCTDLNIFTAIWIERRRHWFWTLERFSIYNNHDGWWSQRNRSIPWLCSLEMIKTELRDYRWGHAASELGVFNHLLLEFLSQGSPDLQSFGINFLPSVSPKGRPRRSSTLEIVWYFRRLKYLEDYSLTFWYFPIRKLFLDISKYFDIY